MLVESDQCVNQAVRPVSSASQQHVHLINLYLKLIFAVSLYDSFLHFFLLGLNACVARAYVPERC